MSARLHSSLVTDRRVRRLSSPAYRLFVSAALYCAKERDGLGEVEDVDLSMIPESSADLADELVAAGLWGKREDVWLVGPLGELVLLTERRKVRAQTRRQILEESGGLCHICGDPLSESESWHADHVIPLARGGTNRQENLRPSHAECNLHKGTKLLSEIAAEGGA